MNKIFIFSTCLVFVIFINPNLSQADIDVSSGYWETSFDSATCNIWDQTMGNPNCDGITKAGDWTCTDGPDFIAEAASRIVTSGDMGYRHFVKAQGVNGGSIQLTLNNPTKELWIRTYVRYESGMTVPDKYKFYYIYGLSGHGNAPLVPENSNRCSYYEQNGGHKTHFSNNCGWINWFGNGEPSDGSWKMIEMYLKYESSTGASDGVYRLWIDDVLVINATDVEHGIGDFWTILVGSNIHNSGYNRCYGVDYDDIVLITDHNNPNLVDDGNGNLHIGPIGSPPSDTTPPTVSSLSPSGTLTSGTNSTTLSVTTNENATCKYSTNSGTSYASMTGVFSTTGGTTHSTTVTGLNDGNSYNYYIRCTDSSGNTNTTDADISFSVANPSGSSNLLWSTTFDCDTDGDSSNGDTEWLQYSDSLVCDGLSKWGSWTTANGNYEQIVSVANNPLGGGKGQRHWVGGGINNNSGSVSVSIDEPKIWLRWYMKYPLGFEWSSLNHDKIMHLYDETGSQIVPEYQGYDQVRTEAAGGSYVSSSGVGWDTVMSSGSLDSNGHRKGDGKWHYWEYFVEPSTGSSKIWVDGILVMNRTGDRFVGTKIATIQISSNQRTVAMGYSDWPVDYDDIAISTTGYIGPIGSPPSDTTPPTVSSLSPSGTLTSGTNSTTLSVTTNENATCKYSTNSGTSYASMTGVFSTTGGTTHSTTVTGLNDGNSYNYYIRCTDSSGNTNTTDADISFSVATGNTPTCTSFAYSSWNDCQSNNTQTRTVLTSSPSGCTGGSPVTTQSCTYTSSEDTEDSSNEDNSSNSSNDDSLNSSNKESAVTKQTHTFTKHLVLGTENEEVRILQQTLNSLGYTVSATGLGSSGNETTYFGKKTLSALNAFQRAHNIPVTLSLDSITRVLLNNLSTAKTTKTSTHYSWSRNLTIGSKGTDVLNLQKILISKGYLTIKNPTTYFGPLTKSALIKYQHANGITPAVGYFGPITCSHINKYHSGISVTSKSAQGELSLKDIVNLFLALGIISEDKRDLALATVNAVE